MGRKIQQQCPTPVTVFVAAVGTAGMPTGVSLELKQTNPAMNVMVLELAESPMLTQGTKGSHSIDSVGVEFIPPMLSVGQYDEVRAMSEARARESARLLAARKSISAGTSTGLNVAAALDIGC